MDNELLLERERLALLVFEVESTKHYGPGEHPSGSPQAVHAGWDVYNDQPGRDRVVGTQDEAEAMWAAVDAVRDGRLTVQKLRERRRQSRRLLDMTKPFNGVGSEIPRMRAQQINWILRQARKPPSEDAKIGVRAVRRGDFVRLKTSRMLVGFAKKRGKISAGKNRSLSGWQVQLASGRIEFVPDDDVEVVAR